MSRVDDLQDACNAATVNVRRHLESYARNPTAYGRAGGLANALESQACAAAEYMIAIREEELINDAV